MTVPYATDYTAIVHHRSRMATANDINMSGLPGGGLDMPAAGWGIGGMAVAAVPVVPLWSLLVPVSAWFSAPVLLCVFIAVYWVAQRDTEGRETFAQRIQLTVMRMFKQPTQIAGMAADKEPTHFTWEAIVARPAGIDGPALPVRQYEHYGYVDEMPAEPIQGRQWPAADESVAQWQRRVWLESGGQLLAETFEQEGAA
ncbi:hypothetical protein [Dietzia sp. 179-F 9C3 NHS]|uniref:hypothetical protein n=1 Tax=Dietzia sp. 179-F 9C3 NHS TaxID=3374295 RepID=UPI003879622B